MIDFLFENIVTVMIAFILFVAFAIPLSIDNHRKTTEVDKSYYETIERTLNEEKLPEFQSRVDEYLKDGMISIREYKQLDDFYNSLTANEAKQRIMNRSTTK